VSLEVLDMKKRKLSAVAGCVRHETFECRADNYGRITIPKAVRERMHWKPGDRIKFSIRPMGTTIVNSGVPDPYYLVLKRLRGKIPRDINLEF
jgi:bifunctional DNA-binding transcriptional regulator/antitoxin component of YhaV-PrlF toxin-antitoxin module